MSDLEQRIKEAAEQWEKVAAEYREAHSLDEGCDVEPYDNRCSICKAYDALSGPREGEQDG